MNTNFGRYEKFSFTVSAIHRSIQKIEAEEMIKLGLKGSFAQYLAIMLHYPKGITAANLCEISFKDKAAVSRAVNEMEQKGLIERKNGNDNSYRANLILTEDGKKAAEYVKKKAENAVNIAGLDLTDKQQLADFYGSLEIIANKLDKITKEGIEDE